MNKLIFLELFILEGSYIVLNDFNFETDVRGIHTFLKGDIIDIEFKAFETFCSREIISDGHLLFKGDFYYIHAVPENIYYDCDEKDISEVIDRVVPNLKKLTADEIMIRDIIT